MGRQLTFRAVGADDIYLCPAGEQLSYRYTNEEDGKDTTPLLDDRLSGVHGKEQCITGKERRISRWEHEAVLETVQARLDRNPDKNARMPPDCRASLRHDKVLDGIDALPHENAQTRQHRVGTACLGLQHETGDAHSGC